MFALGDTTPRSTALHLRRTLALIPHQSHSSLRGKLNLRAAPNLKTLRCYAINSLHVARDDQSQRYDSLHGFRSANNITVLRCHTVPCSGRNSMDHIRRQHKCFSKPLHSVWHALAGICVRPGHSTNPSTGYSMHLSYYI